MRSSNVAKFIIYYKNQGYNLKFQGYLFTFLTFQNWRKKKHFFSISICFNFISLTFFKFLYNE